MSKVIIKKSKIKSESSFDVSFSRLTEGEILSIKNALEFYNSPVAQDVLAYFNNGVAESPLKDRV